MPPQNKRLAAPASGVTVRMYNPGYGDCFLLAFRAEDGSPRYMLIDCGVHHSVAGRQERMAQVVQDLAQATDSHLHFVAITHEHTDHLDGFALARDAFSHFQIDNLWLAWTENSREDLVRNLKKKYGKDVQKLAMAVRSLRAVASPLADSVQAILGFEYQDELSAAGENPSPLKDLRNWSGKKPEKKGDYLRPWQTPLTLPSIKGVKIHVLGPPEKEQWLKSTERESQMYPKLAATGWRAAFAAAVLSAVDGGHLDEEDKELLEAIQPFDSSFRISKDAACQDPFFQKHYGFTPEEHQGPTWRRIDTEWLAEAEQLALDIGDYTNNTSLVLAFELGENPPGKVLLFVGDAQIGNWLSWEGSSGKDPGPHHEQVVQLLAQTVLYKVGHHGSRNATAKQKGLELMTNDELVAMIPVNEEFARGQTPPWDHPATQLRNRIEDKTKGRLIRSDMIPEGNNPPAKPDRATEWEWQNFCQHLDWDRSPDRLWIQYTVPA